MVILILKIRKLTSLVVELKKKKKNCKAKFVVTYPQHGFCVNANFKFFLHFFQMWMRINRCSYEGKYSAIVLM